MTRINFLFNVGVLFLGIYLALVSGHGRLLDPIARSSAWRRDTRFPVYYNDNEMFCGGFGVQWEKNGGKCGICGENYAAKKLFEKGGSMYRGFSVRSYKEGQHIDVNVGITTNHLGWFEFRICNVDGMTTDATQDCLDKIVLKDANGVSKFPIPGRLYDFKTKLVLPSGLLCNKCVFQWKYLTGNSWGVDPKTGKGCMGCGPEQEQFYGCADVTITKDGSTTPEEPNNGNNENNNGNNENSNENNENNNGNNESSSDKCKAGDGYYADKSTQCKKFYYCSNSGTSSEKISYFECPAGLIFNAVGKFCDYAHNHDC